MSFGANEGIYARADRGTFGNSSTDAPSLAEVKAKFVYALFQISGPTISATRDNPGAFEDALALQLDQTITGSKLDMARMILNYQFGIIGTVKGRSSSTVITAYNPFGLGDYLQDRPLRNILRANMPIDVRAATGTSTPGAATSAASSTVTSVVNTTVSTVTMTAESGTFAATNVICRDGNYAMEPDGFFTAVGTGPTTYLGITKSGLTGWNGVVTDAAAGGSACVALDPDMLRDTMDTIMEVSGEAPDLILANYKQRRNIYNLYAPQIRYAPMVLPAGLRENTLAFDDIPVVAERFFPPEHIGFVNTKSWYHAIDKDVEWIQGLNGTVLHFMLTADLFLAVLRTYRNLACLYPASNGYISSLAE